MFRLPPQPGLMKTLQASLSSGHFSATCLEAVLERAVLSHSVEVVAALLAAGAEPTRALVAQVALPRSCDSWGESLPDTGARLAARREQLFDLLVQHKPLEWQPQDARWRKNIEACHQPPGEGSQPWVSVEDALGAEDSWIDVKAQQKNTRQL